MTKRMSVLPRGLVNGDLLYFILEVNVINRSLDRQVNVAKVSLESCNNAAWFAH